MLDCKQTTQIISQSLDRKLTLRERFAVRLHLLVCSYCKLFSQHLQTMRVALKAMTSHIENDNSIKMPSLAKDRIAALVEENHSKP